MRKWIDAVLDEAVRDASLYHETGLWSAMEIIHTDAFLDKTVHFIGNQEEFGVSLSRNFAWAKDWGYVVFALNQQKLRQTHKIVTIDYWAHSHEVTSGAIHRRKDRHAEAEEFVIGAIDKAQRYIVAIHVEQSVLQRWQQQYPHDKRIALLFDHPKLQLA